jgi:hypothetical protein
MSAMGHFRLIFSGLFLSAPSALPQEADMPPPKATRPRTNRGPEDSERRLRRLVRQALDGERTRFSVFLAKGLEFLELR